MNNKHILIVLLAIFAFMAFLPGLGSLPAMDRDESRFAQASRQMLESHDFIDIRFQDAPRYKKPVGIYWMQATATTLAGGESLSNPIATYRLPSLLAAILSILLTFFLSMKMTGSREKSLLAALLLTSSLILGAEARLAKTDAVLLATTLAAMLGLWQIRHEPEKRWFFLFWCALGLGILVKGPVIFIPTGFVLLLDGDRTLFRKTRPLPGLLLLSVIVLPWLVAITLASHGHFWLESVGADMLAKTASAQESHGAPPGTYLLLLPLCLWAAFLPLCLGARNILRRWREPGIRFLLAWAVPFWLLFEAMPTKLVHYILPVYPALAILAVIAIPTTSRKVEGVWLFLWGLAGLALAALPIFLPLYFDGRILLPGLLSTLTILMTILAALIAFIRRRPLPLSGIATSATLAMALIFGFVLPGLSSPFPSRALAAATRNISPPMSRMVLVGYHEPSAVMTLGTKTRLADSLAEAANILGEDSLAVTAIPDNEESAFMAIMPTAQRIGTVSGFNYSKGKPISLILLRNNAP
ncbi:MAG TPA: glycosyl transferase [Rhodospirillaceae bacterium]|nr:MAG: hypothetical protein A2018_03750 [Alphaproteobacteria bacterium GWF2_58_20]HAU29734.1 glycosyl transferase [Rhodospirillaceae bacterium]